MSQLSLNSTSVRLILPESIWLEPEHFYQAIQTSNQIMNESQQWQIYLNSLGLLGFEQWLTARLPEQLIQKHTHVIETCAQLQLGEFKFCLISTENILDEVVNIPESTIHQHEQLAHFYVVLEVSEEQEEVIIRGCLRYDRLITYCSSDFLQDGFYQLPLSVFDPEPNHLLHYYLYLEPSSIPLPVATPEQVSDKILTYFNETRTKLSQWFLGACDEGWEIIDSMLDRETNLAFNTRNAQSGIKRAKLIDLGVQLGNQTVALLVNITEETEEKLGVLIQLHPTNGERVLPSNVKLTLFSKAGKTLQEVTSRTQDNYIQLKPFKGETGKRFSLEVSLEETRVREHFEL
ncbi:DUF1822 family protein [Tolypothrix campylonemoides VB511288_2]|uniref:DUF1822 family protein n=3 Tax=Nostocales TaxID=1161 RepID=A0A0C1RNQ5_9CYAN|nr:DUF1822 family protein [Tolypothrix bouteillei]KAF3884309.1 DUF1822 family protein [Tolypothrix bouteillei VB521301]